MFQDGSGSSSTTAPQTIPLPVPQAPEMHSPGHSKLKTTAGPTLRRRHNGQVQLTQTGAHPESNACNARAEHYRQKWPTPMPCTVTFTTVVCRLTRCGHNTPSRALRQGVHDNTQQYRSTTMPFTTLTRDRTRLGSSRPKTRETPDKHDLTTADWQFHRSWCSPQRKCTDWSALGWMVCTVHNRHA